MRRAAVRLADVSARIGAELFHQAAAVLRESSADVREKVRIAVYAHQRIDQPISEDRRAATAVLQIASRRLQPLAEVSGTFYIEVRLGRHIEVARAHRDDNFCS